MSVIQAPISALSIEALPILSQILMLGLTIVTFVLVYYLLHPWFRRRRQLQGANVLKLSDTMTAQARPLIGLSEVALFNLLHLVSRDMFLVFAKIPLRTLVQVSAGDENARRDIVKAIRNLTADFVLVHPGTMLPSKIVMVEVQEPDSTPSSAPHILIKVLCQEAGIDLIPLQANRNYSAMELTETLGLKEED
ncbi:MAG: DUF2726 domain-containing protein [Nitrospirae bacterium]|nr:DUF2726 domain-containing protein [Nitrospirota bacterium]MDA1305381.1 DUF2726 domain-containing protein [Nitrospirota bacterium]